MKTRIWVRMAFAAACIGTVPASLYAYKAPQANWIWEEHRGWNVPSPYGIAMHDGQLFVLSENKVKVYETDGSFFREFGSAGTGDGQFTDARGIAINGDEVFVADSEADRVQVFDVAGNFLRKWGSTGSGEDELDTPVGIAVDATHVFLVEKGNHRIQVFRHDGSFARAWGSEGTLPGQFFSPRGIAVDEGHVYVTDYRPNSTGSEGIALIQVFLKDGTFVRRWNAVEGLDGALAVDGTYVYAAGTYDHGGANWAADDGTFYISDKTGVQVYYHRTTNRNPAVNPPLHTPLGIALDNPFAYLVDKKRNKIVVYRMAFRTAGSPASLNNAIPTGEIVSINQRPGTAVLDVRYKVADDDAQITAWPLAFSGSTITNLTTAVAMKTLVEGTWANIGVDTPANVIHTVSWDMSADWPVDYGDVRIAVFAKDTRNLLDIHFLHLPAVPANNAPAIVMSRRPIQENDLLNLWFWLIASGDSGIRLVSGEIHGVGGAHDGQLLAQSTTTTPGGRAYLWAKLGVREATADEVQKAKEASTPGTITQRDARYPIGSNGPPRPVYQPAKINEFSFDTSTTTGWWVVKE